MPHDAGAATPPWLCPWRLLAVLTALFAACLLAQPAFSQDDDEAAGADEQANVSMEEIVGEPDDPILLQADTLTYDGESRTWSAVGSVEASRNGRVLTADRVTYDEATGKVIASGNVQLTDPSGPTAFAERIEVEGDFKAGIITGLRLVFSEDARLASARAVREEDGVTILEKAVYSPCRVCQDGGKPFWQFKASRIIHDEKRRTVSYRNARFEIYGVPIAFIPYFRHPDPTVKRKSGFLVPTIGNSNELGTQAEIPYFVNLRPNMDLTLSPLVTSVEGLVAKGEFRHRTRRGAYTVSGSIANAQVFDDVTGAPEGRSIRGHLFGDGKFQLNNTDQWGYRLQLTSDDTYLRRFNITEQDRLTTNLFFNRFKADGGRTTYDGFFFDGLRLEDDDATTPIVPALVEHRSVFEDPFLGGKVFVDLNALSIIRTENFDDDLATNGVDTQRGSLTATWERSTVSRLGDVLTLTAQGRADVYHTTDNETIVGSVDVPDDEGNLVPTPLLEDEAITETRLVALAAADWRWPFVKGSGDKRHVIEPIVQLVYSPLGGNPDGIPNEDSVSFEFDETNLFAFNKFTGLDVWESGPRANLGVRYATYGRNFSASVLLGQSLRLDAQEEFVEGSGLEDEISDYVGRVNFQAGNFIDVTHRFRIDRDELTFERNEVDLSVRTRPIDLQVSYLTIEEQPELLLEERAEIRLEGGARLAENWFARGGARRDLEGGEMISNFAGLIYRNECTEIEGIYQQTFTEDRDVEPETAILFRFKLRSAGS